MPDRRLLAALAFSVLAHALAMSNPAWRLPFDSEPDHEMRLEAHLLAPPKLAPAPIPQNQAKPTPHAQSRSASSRPMMRAAAPSDYVLPPVQEAPVAPEPTLPALQPVLAEPTAPPPQPVPKVEITWPRQGHIRFVVTRGEKGLILGKSTHTWEHDETRYSIRTVTETTGLVALFKPIKIVQVSVGAIGPAGLLPGEFHVEREGKVAEGARFDNEAKRVTLTDGGIQRRENPLAAGTQDLLSHLYQFGVIEKQARFELMIATGKKYASYAYDLVGQETLATRFGDVRTLHYRTPPMQGEQTMEIWLAPDYRNLPVRIRFIDRSGDIYDQNADEIDMDGKTITASSGP